MSCNLLDPDRYGPEQLYDAVATLVADAGPTPAGRVEGAELVGLVPESVLAGVPRAAGPSSDSRRNRRWSPGSRRGKRLG